MKRQVPVTPVVALALLILAAVGFFLVLKPKMDEGGRLDDRIAEFQGKVDTALAAQRTAGSAEQIEVADFFRLTKAMPDATDMAGVILELNGVAESAGVDFLSITPQAPATREGFQSTPIQLTFEGNYYDLTDFLFRLRNLVVVRDGELEAAGRLFTLDALGLAEGPDGFPQIQAALTVSAYTYAPAPPAAAPGTTPPATTTAPVAENPAALGTG